MISTKCNFKASGPMTRCKLNMDQEKWPCTKNQMHNLFNICPKFVVLGIFFMFDLLPFFLFSSFPIIMFLFGQEKDINKTAFLCHGPNIFSQKTN